MKTLHCELRSMHAFACQVVCSRLHLFQLSIDRKKERQANSVTFNVRVALMQLIF